MSIKLNTICLWCQMKKHIPEAEALGDEDTAMGRRKDKDNKENEEADEKSDK